MTKLGGFATALRREGWRATVARSRTEIEWWRQRRQYRPLRQPWPQVEVLRVASRAPHPARGGVERALLDRLAVESSRWALIAADQGGIRLDIADRRARFTTVEPLPFTAQSVLEIARRLGARLIHLENLAPLDPESLQPLIAPGAPPLVLGLHDLGAFCVRAHLLDAHAGVFCHFSRDPQRCATCLSESGSPPVDLGRRRAASARLMAHAAAVVTASDWLGRRLVEELGPELAVQPRQPQLATIAPATASEEVAPPNTVSARPPRRVAVLGAFRHDKGAQLVLAALDLLERRPQLGQFGPIDPALADLARTTFGLRRGFYRPGTLGRELQAHAIDLAVIASVVPESHSLVADEAWRAGVPIITFDRGALAQRVRALGGGLLVPAEDDPEHDARALAQVLAAVLSGEATLPAVPPATALPTPLGAARAFAELYRNLLDHED